MAVSLERQARNKVGHLNRVLGAMISIHQLIAREKDHVKLLKGICHQFIESRGYHDAWVALLDSRNKLRLVAQSGLGEFFPPIVERLKRGELTNCAQMALAVRKPVVCVDQSPVCDGCPTATPSTRGAWSWNRPSTAPATPTRQPSSISFPTGCSSFHSPI